MDLDKNVNLIKLYDIYGRLLTDKQKQVFELYVKKDLSLKEVSEILNITRQAVKFTLDSIEKTLNHYEEELMIVDKFELIYNALANIEEAVKDKELKAKIEKLLEDL